MSKKDKIARGMASRNEVARIADKAETSQQIEEFLSVLTDQDEEWVVE